MEVLNEIRTSKQDAAKTLSNSMFMGNPVQSNNVFNINDILNVISKFSTNSVAAASDFLHNCNIGVLSVFNYNMYILNTSI